jgi:hypothetical protein
MLKDLVHKELRLEVHPAQWAFLVLAALLLIPQWLYYITFLYLFILVMVRMQTDKANNSLVFAALLPVRKRDIVTARTLAIVAVELVYLLLAAICAIVRLRFYPQNNSVSMNSNVAFFGTAFLMYAVFNAICISGSYKRAYRILWPILGGTVISMAVGAILNTLPVFIPTVSRPFNDQGLGHLPYQLAVLAVGIAAFVGATIWANKKGAASFEMVDL